jgi:tetratricopeptide (TPR) repeat protein
LSVKVIALLKRISPEAPMAMGNELCWHWDQVKDKAAGWEKSHGSHPEVARELGIAYLKVQQFDDAERNFRKLIEIAPDQDGYYNLAYLHEQKGQPDKAIDVLKEFCEKCEDFGLQHAQAQVRIANYCIKKGDIQQAVIYADQAAQTRAAWATSCSEYANELAGNWDIAEQWAMERSHHYANSTIDWYLWCKRTGHGNEQAAQKLADQFVHAYQSNPESNTQFAIGDVYLLEGKLKEARDAYQKSFDNSPDPVCALYIAFVSHDLNEPAARDQVLAAAKDKAKNAVNSAGRKRVELLKLVEYIADAFKANKPLEFKKVDDLLVDTPDRERTNIRYFASRHYRLHNQPDVAKNLLIDSVKEDRENLFTTTLVWSDLRDMGEDPVAIREKAIVKK